MIVATRSGGTAGVPPRCGGRGRRGGATTFAALASARFTARRSQNGSMATVTGFWLPFSTRAVKSSSIRILWMGKTGFDSMTVDDDEVPSAFLVVVTLATSYSPHSFETL